MKKACIISVGNELLAGLTVNTNASYLSRELMAMGIPAVSCYTVGDRIDSISRVLSQAAQQADIILITGGLGPTDDDLTRQALARFLQVELEFSEELLSRISDFFKRRDLKMSEKNKVQAYIPAGARAIANNVGTAPGIMAELNDKIFICLPGVPEEMTQMFARSVSPRLKQAGGGQVVLSRKLNCFGTGESVIAEKLGNSMQRNRNPLINCTVSGGVITLHIVATAADRAIAEDMIEKDSQQLRALLGDIVYGRDEQTLAEVIGAKLRKLRKSLAVAESCTGGLIGKLLTDVPGSSDYFKCGWITYSNEVKVRELGVDGALIEKHGSVSKEVAIAMAEGVLARADTDFAIAVTGIAGPGGGTEQKPVGLVYIAVTGPGWKDIQRYIFSHSRGHIRYRTALTALNMLRLKL
ncbi:MAG TPA: competence/damage-inducible protein A [Planctomycetes bacterium]|nr:competence/damage-inducible protein A [Planctomycetota bacterium]HIJ70999.1 competence/damage-inducible protein A [Planctomycetota bacterium]